MLLFYQNNAMNLIGHQRFSSVVNTPLHDILNDIHDLLNKYMMENSDSDSESDSEEE